MRNFIKRTLFFIALISPFAGQAEDKKTLAILTYHIQGETPWDPDSIKTGITGSEEAVVYMSKQLADLGYKVTVFAFPPAGSKFSLLEANPRFVKTDEFDPKDLYDIVVVWRTPAVGKEVSSAAKKMYFWPHDHAYPLMLAKEQVDAYDGVLWLSSWQRKEWLSKHPLFGKFKSIFGNGINPEQFTSLGKKKNPYSCIYGSNYGRGLDVLLDAWPTIKERFPKATLDIYYGWQSWGLLSKEKEQRMRKQIASFRSLGVQEHGLVGHEELNRAYREAAFWTYPCTNVETFCITALRAEMSGAIPVILEGSALPETVPIGYKCSRVEDYTALVLQAMEDVEANHKTMREQARSFVLSTYTWKAMALKWKEFFERDAQDNTSK